MKIGWLLKSNNSYTNHSRATKDLLQRIGEKGTELELPSHSLSHSMADGEVLQARALKVVTTVEYSEQVVKGIMTVLTGDVPDE